MPSIDLHETRNFGETAEDRPTNRAPHACGAQLFLLFEGDRPAAGGGRIDLREVDEVLVGRGAERGWQDHVVEGRRQVRLTLPGSAISGKHARLARVGAKWVLQDRGSRNGTWLGGRRIDVADLADGEVFDLGRTFFGFRTAIEAPGGAHLGHRLSGHWTASTTPGLGTLLPDLAARFQDLAAAARAPLSILLGGATGTGKEVLARAIHQLSGREGPFVAVNCAAIPATLVESSLFGHVKGAFSGATSHELGFVRASDHGTLLLDEIGDLPLPAQAALLRVIQEHEVVPVGSTRQLPVDLRVVCASHQDLGALVENKLFRADLWARISGFCFRIPELSQRIEDLGLLLPELLRELAPGKADTITLSSEAGRLLVRYRWPLNIRELKQVLAHALALAPDGALDLEHLPLSLRSGELKVEETPRDPAAAEQVLRQELEQKMADESGNVAAVARAMRKGPTQIQRWIKRFGINPDTYRK